MDGELVWVKETEMSATVSGAPSFHAYRPPYARALCGLVLGALGATKHRLERGDVPCALCAAEYHNIAAEIENLIKSVCQEHARHHREEST